MLAHDKSRYVSKRGLVHCSSGYLFHSSNLMELESRPSCSLGPYSHLGTLPENLMQLRGQGGLQLHVSASVCPLDRVIGDASLHVSMSLFI